MRTIAIAVAIAVLVTAPAFAWNALGHKVIVEIAWRELDTLTRLRIVDTVRRHPRHDDDFAGKMTDDVLRADKATRDRWIFQHAATWPDIGRGLPAGERGKYDRPTWHYINLPTFLDPSDRMALEGRLKENVSPDYPTSISERQYNVLQAIAHSQYVLSKDTGADPESSGVLLAFSLGWRFTSAATCTALYSMNQFPEGNISDIGKV